MTFNESDVQRDTSGRFDHKVGSASGVELPVTQAQKIKDIPLREPFLMYPGRETDLDNGDIIEWMEETGVTGRAVYIGQRYADDGKGPTQHRYSVTLERDGKTMEVPYSTGLAWDEAPSAGLVIDSLVADAQLHSEGKRSFVSMLESEGTPSVKAAWQYTELADQTRQFREFAGDDFARLTGIEDRP